MIEADGEGSMLKFLDAEEIHTKTFGHKVTKYVEAYVNDKGALIPGKTDEVIEEEIMTLYRSKENIPGAIDPVTSKSNSKMAWLKMECPSTGTGYLLNTSPSFEDVEQAAKFHRAPFIPNDVDYNWSQRS